MTLITSDIEVVKQELINGGIVPIPTETVYGLAGNIYSDAALSKIFELKNRPFFNPLIVHIKSIHELQKIASEIPEKALKLASAFWPGPLTLILKKQPEISDIVTAGKDTVAVRVPNHKVALALLENLDFPVAAPSANPFGSISPTSATHVFEYFKGKIPYILEGGNCKKGVESTIIGFVNNEPILYRHGSISIEEIEKIVGKVTLLTLKEDAPDAPGMLAKHYAPNTPIFLTSNLKELIKLHQGKKIGLLLFKAKMEDNNIAVQEILAPNGNLEVATSNLYAALHKLDKCNLDVIIAEIFPAVGLGNTINDRLERATKK
ncbi:L-threonylcarbamoyladenylate synthase [Lutibacter sp.]|uniref:L-threonylcarbamoyladenylate synthase n=1 Tax=Lutibacter sp. TaxID=1925666 RepID=UPI0027325AE1|nr:L-threonylcarbamoyladenylate synthase [Lutibacter sp.]MDP3313102.1 L-threonylcarbamoyladenylate synthase [Lutibacter sp.]